MTWDEFLAACIPTPATITVEAWEGTGAQGPVYAAAADVTSCVVENQRRQVAVTTQDAGGRVVISGTTVRCPPELTAPAGSRVTLPGGIVTNVLKRVDWRDHGIGLPSHTELLCE